MSEVIRSLIESGINLLCGGCCIGIVLLIGAVYMIHLRMPDELRRIIRNK